jgi:hypothetical protein
VLKATGIEIHLVMLKSAEITLRPYQKLHTAILMVQAAKGRGRGDSAGPLNRSSITMAAVCLEALPSA